MPYTAGPDPCHRQAHVALLHELSPDAGSLDAEPTIPDQQADRSARGQGLSERRSEARPLNPRLRSRGFSARNSLLVAVQRIDVIQREQPKPRLISYPDVVSPNPQQHALDIRHRRESDPDRTAEAPCQTIHQEPFSRVRLCDFRSETARRGLVVVGSIHISPVPQNPRIYTDLHRFALAPFRM